MITAEDLLRRLLEHHFDPSCDEFHWSYIEGTAIADVDPDLARDLAEWLGAQKNQKAEPDLLAALEPFVASNKLRRIRDHHRAFI